MAPAGDQQAGYDDRRLSLVRDYRFPQGGEVTVESPGKLMETYAARAVEWMRGPDYEMELPFSEVGVRLLEDVPQWEEDGEKNGILEEMTLTKHLFDGENPLETIAMLFGSYLGEVMRRTCGGEWVAVDDPSGESVALLVGGMHLFPHQKALHRLQELDDGEGDQNNVWDYFQTTKALATKTKRQSRRRRN